MDPTEESEFNDQPHPDHPWTKEDDEDVANYTHPFPDFGGVRVDRSPD